MDGWTLQKFNGYSFQDDVLVEPFFLIHYQEKKNIKHTFLVPDVVSSGVDL